MKTSIIPATGKTMLITSIFALSALNYGFKAEMSEQEWLNWSNKCLSTSFNPLTEPNLKKWEINLTADYFLRLRKTYQQGKQEYYSFNIKRFTNINYIAGDALTDTLRIKTQTDDIIVQTYNDPEGDVDSMATMLNIPLKKTAPERLDSLKQALMFLKAKGL